MNKTSLLLGAVSALAIAAPAVSSGGPATAAAKAPMTLAAAKHNGSGVELRHAVPPALRAGETAVVRLQFDRIVADDASVELRGEAAELTLRIGGQPVTGPIALERGRSRTIEVEVSAPDGMQYLNVFTTQNGRLTAQAIALPFGSGKRADKANGLVKTTASGERVISLPSK